MFMERVAIVILNYLNYQDTIECLNSIEQLAYPLCGIVIVDNGSTNESCAKIKEQIKNRKDINLIKNGRNLGFAKGNNVGIRYARKKLNAEFVLVINNDTVFIQHEYIDRMLEKYENNVAIMGSEIVLKEGIQLPCRGYFTGRNCVLRYLNHLSAVCGSCFDFKIDEKASKYMLHGCALLFTPVFFKYYKGFYPKTFLFQEENILYLMCENKGIRQVYVKSAQIFHKEDQSSELSFENCNEIKQKYSLSSEKYVLWWIIKNRVKRLITGR